MRPPERALWGVAVVVLLMTVLWRREGAPPTAVVQRQRPQPGVRLSMNALHQQGGVPLGWQPTLPPGDRDAGRRTFEDLGCATCHRITGESFAPSAGEQLGPDLAGMGTHHPPAYFAEAILNPDAVLIDAPGYIGDDGHSIMPMYPDMTIGQLSDLVAYLTSLTQSGGAQSCHAGGSSPAGAALVMSSVDLRNRPAPAARAARSFFAQTYDILPGQLEAFEAWFATEGRRQFLAAGGLVNIETFVDASRPAPAVTSLFGFHDEAALRNFMGDPATAELWRQFDAFVGPHAHYASDRPLVYRAPSLSAE
jgi:mono/diheme cytochrome c family protein